MKIADGIFCGLAPPPPYSNNVPVRIGQSFLQLIDTHFPKNLTLNKISNRNNIKVSYSYMQYIKTIIDNHNINILPQNGEIKEGVTTGTELYLFKVRKTYRQISLFSGKNHFILT